MIVPKITEMSETTSGGLYVVVEFRNGNGKIVCTEDFRWKTFDSTKHYLDVDRYGRVSLNGQRVFPTVEGVPRDLSQAVFIDEAKSKEEIMDEVMIQVLKFRDSNLSDEKAPRVNGNRTLDKKDRPKGRRSRARALRAAKAGLEGKNVLGDKRVLVHRANKRREESKRQR